MINEHGKQARFAAQPWPSKKLCEGSDYLVARVVAEGFENFDDASHRRPSLLEGYVEGRYYLEVRITSLVGHEFGAIFYRPVVTHSSDVEIFRLVDAHAEVAYGVCREVESAV